jgi:hypothetical protein
MKNLEKIIIAAIVVLLMGFMPGSGADARGGHGGYGGHGNHVGVGVWLGPGWGPGWWGPYYYPNYYPYYQELPVVIEQQPDVYIQPAPQPEQQPIYWYFCNDPQGYYPYVKQCPSGWMKVAPTPPAPPSEPTK